MEFNIEKDKVFGIVDFRLKGDCARIKVLGYINAIKSCVILNESELKELFPPIGYIFEPGFFNNFNFKEGELVIFRAKEIELSRPDGDIYRINTDNNARPCLFGSRVFEITNFEENNSFVNLSITKIIDENYSHGFYGIFKNKLFGRLKMVNGKIAPETGHFIKEWATNQKNIFKYKNNQYLLHEHPDGQSKLIDTMDEKAAFKWFKEKLGILNSDVVSYLNNKTNWSKVLPEILINQNEDETEVDKIRLRRISKSIDKHILLVEEIKEIAKTSENLQNAFKSSIERHKIELRSEYASEIIEFEKINRIEKQKLESQLSRIAIEIALKNKHLNDLKEEINCSNLEIENINTNKERILSDFAIIHKVLGSINPVAKSSRIHGESFVIESTIPALGVNLNLHEDKFKTRLKYYLNQRNINLSLSEKLISVFSAYKGIFLGDIELGLSFIEASSNSNYIIQHVEPDWLHFIDLWKNGLEAIWKLSQENPNKLHFLILEDVNMSSPECYMRPLLDSMNGIRKQIPYAKSSYPENLRILATKISTDEPRIGLPLYGQTFKNWAAIGFIENIYKIGKHNHPFADGYLESVSLSSYKTDEFDLALNASSIAQEFKELFDI